MCKAILESRQLSCKDSTCAERGDRCDRDEIKVTGKDVRPDFELVLPNRSCIQSRLRDVSWVPDQLDVRVVRFCDSFAAQLTPHLLHLGPQSARGVLLSNHAGSKSLGVVGLQVGPIKLWVSAEHGPCRSSYRLPISHLLSHTTKISLEGHSATMYSACCMESSLAALARPLSIHAPCLREPGMFKSQISGDGDRRPNGRIISISIPSGRVTSDEP